MQPLHLHLHHQLMLINNTHTPKVRQTRSFTSSSVQCPMAQPSQSQLCHPINQYCHQQKQQYLLFLHLLLQCLEVTRRRLNPSSAAALAVINDNNECFLFSKRTFISSAQSEHYSYHQQSIISCQQQQQQSDKRLPFT